MIEDLLQMRAHLDSMIETYKDLHPDEEDENYHLGRGNWDDIGTTIGISSSTTEEYCEQIKTHDRGNNTHLDGMSEYNQREQALKKIRKGTYENKFSKSQRKKVTGHGQGNSKVCIQGDT
tara:strand:- start:2048 stop:2407 length:360 start_codon:yes stop_codon:yes gene_type:complete